MLQRTGFTDPMGEGRRADPRRAPPRCQGDLCQPSATHNPFPLCALAALDVNQFAPLFACRLASDACRSFQRNLQAIVQQRSTSSWGSPLLVSSSRRANLCPSEFCEDNLSSTLLLCLGTMGGHHCLDRIPASELRPFSPGCSEPTLVNVHDCAIGLL